MCVSVCVWCFTVFEDIMRISLREKHVSVVVVL